MKPSEGTTALELQYARQLKVIARQRYHDAVLRAREEGWSKTEIARALGVTEAAIRLYLKRHRLEDGDREDPHQDPLW